MKIMTMIFQSTKITLMMNMMMKITMKTMMMKMMIMKTMMIMTMMKITTMRTMKMMITEAEEAAETEETETSKETARVDLLPEEEEVVPVDVLVQAPAPDLGPVQAPAQVAGVDHLHQEMVPQEEVLHR